MISRTRDDGRYVVHYRSYRMAAALLILPPLMLYEFLPALVDGSMDMSDLVALLLGVLVPLLAAYWLIELSSFTFLQADNIFRFRWRNPLRRKSLDLPLDRIVSVRRQVMESNHDAPRSRLVVVLDDNSVIGLTRGFTAYQNRDERPAQGLQPLPPGHRLFFNCHGVNPRQN